MSLQNSTSCISDDLLYRYLDGQLKGKALRHVEAHINQCSECMDQLVFTLSLNEKPISQDEGEMIRQLDTLSPEAKLDQIRPFLPAAPSQENNPSKHSSDPLYQFFGAWGPRRIKPAWVVAALLVAFLGVRWGVSFYNTTWQLWRAKASLEQHEHFYIAEARLAGEYSSTGMSMLMNDNKESEGDDVYARSNTRIERVLARQPKRPEALQLAAQLAIFQQHYGRADSLLNVAVQLEPNAAIYNDLGKLAYDQAHYIEAQSWFQQSIAADSSFATAYYNLALVETELNQLDSARQRLQIYLELEDHEDWRRAAQRLLQEIS